MTIGVPCSPGTPLLTDVEEAVTSADHIGYPVILKPAGGGGGIGMCVCDSATNVRSFFERTRSLAMRFFADSGVFIEKYVRKGRHIEVQVFGDGQGNVVHFGERECSVQRRYQKLIEESPSTALTQELRERICGIAVNLCKHVKYESAGTVEFILDEDSQEFYFLEVNTRIQVEHGVTEMAINGGVIEGKVDLVEWMIRQGHSSTRVNLLDFQWEWPTGSAIELRIYAEDALNDFQPSPGALVDFELPISEQGSRFDTWCYTGCPITPAYDPLIVKIIQYGPTRALAIKRLLKTLSKTSIKGVQSNLNYLSEVVASEEFITGNTFTTTLDSFKFNPKCFKVLNGGMNVSVQDFPGRTRRGLWRVGVPPSGPYDHLASRLANSLVKNASSAATLEVTVRGPTLQFLGETYVAVVGAPFDVTLNGIKAPMYQCLRVEAGHILTVGELSSNVGARCYIAIRGGVDVPKYLGSRSTFAKGGFGGLSGRELRAGDVIDIGQETIDSKVDATVAQELSTRRLPDALWPHYTNDWVIRVLPGPLANPDYMTNEDIVMLHSSKWTVHHNSNRLGIRLTGPSPQWARPNGGEGGSHPSNIHDCEYAIGTINFTGNMPVILGHDGPSLGGFVCPCTCIASELWKLGQLKAGDTVQFKLVDIETAIVSRRDQNEFIDTLRRPEMSDSSSHHGLRLITKAVLLDKPPIAGMHPGMQVRLAGDSYMLVEYGPMVLDILFRIRVHVLEQRLLEENIPGLEETAPGVRSLQIRYNPLELPPGYLLNLISTLDAQIGDISTLKLPSRVFHMPMTWNSSGVNKALDLYTRSVRAEAPYLPSNIEFVAKNNGINVDDVYEKMFSASYMVLGLGDVYLGACCAVPIDPRHRVVNPKFNPARTYSEEGTVGLGGAYMCIYPMDSPGGYQLMGRTLPIWNTWATNPHMFSPSKTWLFDMFDQIRFYPVPEDQLNTLRESFKKGTYCPKVEEEVFDVAEYVKFCTSIQEETDAYRTQQQNASAIMNEAERESLARLHNLAQGTTDGDDRDGVDSGSLQCPTGCQFVTAVITAKVWNIKVQEGAVVKKGETLIVLEAMKMEINIDAPCAGTIETIIGSVGAMVTMGTPLVVLREAKIEDGPNEQGVTDVRYSMQLPHISRYYCEEGLSVRSLVMQLYTSIENLNKKSNCSFIDLHDKEKVLEAITALNDVPSDTASYPLYGVPFLVQSDVEVKGFSHNAASVSSKTALSVLKLTQAGAILLGRTLSSGIAVDAFGLCDSRAGKNLFNQTFSSGGYCSASAVAVSMGLCSFTLCPESIGTGSAAAAAANIVSFTPSFGRISCTGISHICKSLDRLSILSLSAADATAVATVCEGEDSTDSYSLTLPPLVRPTAQSVTFVFGVPRADYLRFFGCHETAEMFERMCSRLQSVGGVRVTVDYRPFIEATELYHREGSPWLLEHISNRYGSSYSVSGTPKAARVGSKTELAWLGEMKNKRGAVSALVCLDEVSALKKAAAKSLKGVDVLLTPTFGRPMPADVQDYLQQQQITPLSQALKDASFYTASIALLHMTSVTIPMGMGISGAPCGATLSATAPNDSRILQIAQQVLVQERARVGKLQEEVHFKDAL